jgi:hypothetical protein
MGVEGEVSCRDFVLSSTFVKVRYMFCTLSAIEVTCIVVTYLVTEYCTAFRADISYLTFVHSFQPQV